MKGGNDITVIGLCGVGFKERRLVSHVLPKCMESCHLSLHLSTRQRVITIRSTAFFLNVTSTYVDSKCQFGDWLGVRRGTVTQRQGLCIR